MSICSVVARGACAFVSILAAGTVHAQSTVDLSPVAVTVPSSAPEASEITVAWTVRNLGSEPLSGTWTDELLLSDDAAFGDDLVLATATVTATVGPGKTYSRTRIVTLPYGEVGSRRIIVRSDVGGAVVETNEANNVLVAPQPIQIEPRYPDLVIVGRPKTADVTAGESITIEYEIRNDGTATTFMQRADELACTFVDASGEKVRRSVSGMMWSFDMMPPGSTVPVSRTLRVPSWVPRDAVWELTVDAMDFIDEGEGEDNNSVSAEVSTVPGDLELDVFTDAATCPGGELEVMYVYRNIGKGTIIPSLSFAWSLPVWTAFYLSLDETLDESDRLLLARPGDEWSLIGWGDGLPPEGSVTVQEYPTVPADVPFGKYRLLVAVDRGDELGQAPDSIFEDPKSDVEIWSSDPIEVGPTYPDLVVTAVSGPSKVESGEWCSVTYTLTNHGLSPVHQVRGDMILVAFDVGGVGRDFQVTEPLFFWDWIEPGASVTRDVLVRVPSAAPAEITWRVATDWEDDVPEGPKGEDNNENDGDVATVGLGDFEVDVATPASVVPGAVFEVRYDYRNVGKTVIMPHYGSVWPPPFPVLAQVYLSTDEVLDSGDLRLLDRVDDAGLILQSGEQWGLQPGETVFRTAFATLPYGTPGGSYRILVAVDRADLLVPDGFDAIAEPDGLDREIWSSDPFEVTDDSGKNPDLVVTRIVGPSEVDSGESVTIEYSIRNDGSQLASGSWYESIHVSVDAVPGNADDRPVTDIQPFAGNLKPGETVDRSVTFLVPASTPRDVRWQVRTDVFNFIAEGGGEGNNVVNGGAVEVTPPDLEMSVATPASTCPGGGITIGYAYANVGGGSAYPPSWSVRLLTEAYLSTDEVLDSGDIWLGWNDDTGLLQFSGDQPGLQPGETVQQTIVSRIPTTLPTGTYRVLIAMDRDVPWQEFDAIWEDPRVDRELWASPAFEVTDDYPDLRVTSVEGPGSVLSGEAVTLRYRVENAGTGPVSEGWYEQVFTSVDGTMGNADDRQASTEIWRSIALAPGESRDFEVDLRVPSWTRDGVRWAVRTDLLNYIHEGPSGEANNALLGDEVSVTPADVVVSVAAPGPITAGQIVPIAYTWTNVGKGTVYPGIGDWFLYSVLSRAFLSTDAALDASDREIWSNQDQWLLFGSGDAAGLQPGESVSSQGSAFAPSDLPPGDYRLIVAIDRADDFGGQDGIYEAPGTDGEIFAGVGDDASDLAVESVDAPTSAAIGSIVTVSWTVRNQGEVEASGPWIDEILLSTDAQAGDDVSLTTVVRDVPLGPGATYVASASVSIPSATASGPYRLLVRTDAGNALVEFDESNNLRAADAVTSIVAPDLSVQAFSVPSQVRVDQSFPVSWTVRNSGTGDASGWTDAVYISADSTFGPEDALLASFAATEPLAAGSDLARSGAVAIPVEAGLGLRHLFVVTDAADLVVEANESNNRSIATPIDVIPAELPDLIPSEFVLASSWSVGQPVVLEWTVSNAGNAATSGSWIESVQAVNAEGAAVFTLTAIGTGDVLAPGASIRRQVPVTIPNLTGAFRFELAVDRDDSVEEGKGDGNNRTLSGDVAILAPDLVAGGVQFPSSLPAGQSIPFAWTVSNVGAGAVYPAFSCMVRFSTDGTLDPGDLGVTVSVPHGTVPAGGSVPVEASVWAGLTEGDYRVFVVVDSSNSVFESDEDNGVVDAGLITVTAPNLVVASVAVQPSAAALGQFEVSWTVSNVGNSPAVAPWNDRVFVSSDDSFGGDTAIFDRAMTEPLSAGESRTVTAMVPAPSLEGQYWVFVQADLFNQVPEGTAEGDNVSPAGGPITVNVPDVVVASIETPTIVNAGAAMSVSWTVSNASVVPAPAAGFDRVAMVSSPDGSGEAVTLGDRPASEPVAAGATVARGLVVTAPNAVGPRFVRVTADAGDAIEEGDGDANNALVGRPISMIAGDLTAVKVTAPSTVEQFVPFDVEWTVRNAGAGDSYGPCWNDRLVLSADAVVDAGDRVLASVPGCTSPLRAGIGEDRSPRVTVTDEVAPGQYFLLVVVDGDGTRFESDEANNVVVAGAVEILPASTPNLTITGGTVSPTAAIGGSFEVSWTVANAGSDAAAATAVWSDRVTLSANETFGDADDVTIGQISATGPLAAGVSRTVTRQFPAPAAPGTYRVRVGVDAADEVFEYQGEGDNLSPVLGPFAVAYPPRPDLVVTSITAPTSAVATQAITISYVVRNQGETAAIGYWREAVELVSDDAPNAPVTIGNFYRLGPLEPGAEITRTNSITLPLAVAGSVRVAVRVDSEANVAEGDPAREANNRLVDDAIVAISEPPLPDLVAVAVTAPTKAVAGDTVTVAWQGRNEGELPTTATWVDRVFLSADAVLSNDDTMLGSRFQAGVVKPGEGWNGSLAVTLPDVTGPRWFLVHVDSGGAIEEGTGEANNARASDVACAIAPRPLPNLAIEVTGTPPSWRAGDTVQVAWRVSSSGDAPARGPWSDGLYLSIDDQVGPDDLPLRVQQYGGDLAVGASYDRLALVNLPVDYQGGTRRLLAKVDVNGLLRQVSNADDLWVSSPFTLEPTPAADLVPSAVAVPTGTLVFGGPITVSFTETNSGSAAATGLWSGMALISKDNRPSSDDVPLGLVGSGGTPLAVGQSVQRTVNAALPLSNDLPAGQYWITVRSDVNAAIPETVETNNVAVVGPFTIDRPPLPNLVMGLGSVPTIAAAGEAFPVTVTTTNSGAQPVTGNTFFRIEAIAEDGALTTLGTLIVTGPIEAGASKFREESFTLPQLSSPSVRVRACADSTDLVVEASETDNCFESTPIAFRRPDLTVVSVNGPATAVAGTSVQVSMTVRNDGTGAAGGFWTEEIRLSTDAEIGSDRSLVSLAVTTPLAAGASVTRNVSVTIPDELEGQLRWVAAVDASQSVYEGDEADNELLGAVIAVQPPDRPNLVVENVTLPPTVLVGKPLSISFTVRNAGTSATAASWSDAAFISDNSVLTPSDASLGTKVRVQNLQPGESYTQIITGIAPVVPGTYRIFAATDANRTVIEESPDGEADNTTLAAGTVVVDDVAVAVEALLAEVEYPAAMPVRIHARTIDGGDPVAGVPVRLVRSVRGYPSTIDAITGPDGFVDVAVQPTAGLAGLYRFGAAVRGRECELAAETVAWGIDVLPASGEIRVPQGGGASGRVTVRNLGDIPVPGTTLVALAAGSGLSAEVTLPDGDVLGPDEAREATYLVSAGAQAQSGSITFSVDSDRTAPRSREVAAVAVPQIATLVAEPTPVVRDMLVGATSYFSVTVRNLGTAPTGPLAVQVSASPWLSLVSPTAVPGLPPGGSANIDFRLEPRADLPLGPYSATPFLVVRDTTNTAVSVAVNGTFTATSDAFASVRILARNEFSYNAATVGMTPSYPTATVEIRRFGQQAIVAGGPVDEMGEAIFDRLEAGLYDLTVTAPQHGIFRGTRRLDPGSNDVTAFLPRQLVNYEWTVVPIPFTDEYRVTINLVFETNVPAPVITVDPVVIDFREMQQPTEYREIRITNHGLITAEDARFEYQSSERYEVIPLYEAIGNLGPGQSRSVPVLLVDRQFGEDGGVADGSPCRPPSLVVVWFTRCDVNRESRQPVGFTVATGCGGGGGGVPWFGGVPACFGCGAPGGGAPGDGDIRPGSFGGINIRMPSFCDECSQKCAAAACELLYGACEYSIKDFLKGVARGLGRRWNFFANAFQCGEALGETLNIFVNRWYYNEEIPASQALSTVGNLATKCAKVNPAIEAAVDIASKLAKILEDCECTTQTAGQGGGQSDAFDAEWFDRLPEELPYDLAFGRCVDANPCVCSGNGCACPTDSEIFACVAQAVNEFRLFVLPRHRAVNRLRDYMKPSAYMLGSWGHIEGVRQEEIQRLKALLDQIDLATDETSLGAGRIVEAEYNAMLSMPRPDIWTPAVLAAFVERWHRSLDYFELGWYRHTDVPEGYDRNFIAFATMSELMVRAGEAYESSISEGYLDAGGPASVLVDRVADSLEGGQGTCVEVAIELEQTVTLTRQAFAATLALDNATAAPIEAIDVDLFIKDLDGNDASAKFAVLPPAVTGMGDANGNGQLDPGASGSVRWTLVPGDSAAPQGPTFYRVSGRLRYGSGGAVVDIPLFPVTITVLPNPSLSLEYFIETQVYSDDPFTPEVEPTVPFSLGLWAKNNGGGTAGDVRVESAQPRIVANESGALIDFQLIGTQVNEDEVSPSLAVSMGDILPGEVAVAQWLMTSSLQGEFTSYSATVRSTNGFNDPEFAVVDEANVSALTHVVRADDPFDDGRPDFLGNLIGNALDLPDRIFLSSGASEPVDAQIDATVTVEGLDARIASEPVNGWKYIRIDDPFEGSRPLSAVIRSDGKELRLGDNAWQTAYITRDTTVPQARRYVHLFDRGGDGVYVAMFAADEIAPSVVSWSAVAAHGAAGPVGLAVPADAPASDSRSGGISKFIVSFSEPIDPETIGPVNVQVTAYNASGVEVDVPVADRTLDLRLGNQYADIGFPTPLPNNLRYCIKLVGVRDLAGNLLEQASASIDLVSLAGDVTGDLRVTVNDAGAIGSLVGTSVIDPTDPYQVRSDVNRDGAITMADATLVVAAIGTDFRFAINPCTLSAAAPPQGMLAGVDGRKGGPAAFAGPRIARRLGTGWWSSANPRDGASTATPEAREDAAADAMPKDGVPPIEFRLIAVRPSSAGAEAFAMAIAAFDLPAVIAGEGEGAWSLHAVPPTVQGEKAFETLRLLLEQAGVETALVVERQDGSFGALRPVATVTWRADIPQTWRVSVVEATVGRWTPSYGLSWDGRRCVLTLETLSSHEFLQVVAALATRPEVERIEPQVDPIGVAPDGVTSGSEAALSAEGEIQP